MFSVIIPSYNRAHSICETLDSVIAQTYRPIEIIIVDDGSVDATSDTVLQWKELTLQTGETAGQLSLKYIKQDNAGAPAARNRGLKEVSGDYIQFLDSDDRLHPDRFSILAQAFEQQNADFIQTSIEWFDPETGETTKTLWARPDESPVDLVLNGEFWANTLRAAISSDLAKRVGPWKEQMTCFEDREYMERAVLQANHPIALRPVLGYLARGEGLHVSSRHTTFQGREWRIYSERQLVEQVLLRDDLSAEIKSILASRIYRLGCRSNVSGWSAYGRQCAEIGDMLKADLDHFAKIKRRLAYMGRVGGWIYFCLDRPKRAVKNLRHK